MRIFLSILILLISLQSLTRADSIKDFEIEGMSIGDSALDHFSQYQIDNGLVATYKDITYTTVEPSNPITKNYDYVSFSHKTIDKRYIMVAVTGVMNFDNKIEKCHKLQDEIFKEIIELFPNAEITDGVTHEMLGKEKGKTRQTFVELKEGDFVAIQCYHWDKGVKRKDLMRVQMISKEYNDWLNTKAF